MSNAELRAVKASTVSGTGIAGSNPLVAAVSRLVPHSGIQFIDLLIKASGLSATVGKFVEEVDPEDGPLLIPIDERTDGDGIEWHPLTGEPLAPSQSLWVSGYQALEPFLDSWVPLPFLRFLGRDEAGVPRFDTGPSNWVRLYVERPAAGLRTAEVLRAVLAIDTNVDAASRIDQVAYVAPNVDDVVFAPIFKLVSDSAQLGEFLAGQWSEAWLTHLFKSAETSASPSADANGPAQSSQQPATFTLEHVARYLSLLKVLDTSAAMPQLQFVDVRSAHWRSRTSGLDLLLDIDTTRTSAALVPARGAGDPLPPHERTCEGLKLRELSRPTLRHEGAFPTAAEFDTPVFGDEHASLHSGRLDAFYWPSLVRVGEEACRLSQANGAAPGQTGLSALIAALDKTEPHADVWRFAPPQKAEQVRAQGPMVSGRLLNHIAEDGSVIARSDDETRPALRPRFSPAALLSMFIAECVLHALTQINDPLRLSTSGHLHTLDRVLVTCPLAASPDERERLQARASQAVELVWTALGWDDDDDLTPKRPEVALNIDAGLSSQLVYLHDEIETRFSGSVRQFVSLLGDAGSVRPVTRERGLRVASLDLSSQATTLSIVDYALGADGMLQPSIEVADRTRIAGDSLVELVMNAHVLPAIANALDQSGHPDGAAMMVRALDAPPAEHEKLGRHFSARFVRDVLIPAASALIELHQAVAGSGVPDVVRRFSIGHLVRLGDGRMAPLDAKFESLAAGEGAREFRLGRAIVMLDPAELSNTIRKHYAAPVSGACAAMRSLRADLLTLSGHHADMAEVADLIASALPFAPHRIVNMNARLLEAAGTAQAAAGARALAQEDPRLATLASAALLGQGSTAQFDRIAATADALRLAAPPLSSAIWLEREAGTRNGSRIPATDDGRLPRALLDRIQAGGAA